MPTSFRSILPIICLLALTLAACSGDSESQSLIVENPFHGPEQETRRYELVVEEVAQFGVEEEPVEQILSRPAAVVEGLGGRVYILDGTRIMMFEPDGSYVGSFGREGEGPGELNRVFGMIGSPWGTLLVQNQGGQRMDFFAADGSFLESVTRDELGYSGFMGPSAILPDSSLVISGGLQGEIGTRVARLDMRDWAVIDSFRVTEPQDIDIPQGISAGGSVAIMDDAVIISNSVRYEIGQFSLQGDTLRLVRRDVPDYTRPGYASFGSGFGVRMFSSVGDPQPLEGGFHLVSSNWPTNISDPDEYARLAFTNGNPPEPITHRSLDVFDSDWKLLFSVENEDLEALNMGYIVHTVAPGEFYTVRYRPYPHVVRVRVRVEEKG